MKIAVVLHTVTMPAIANAIVTKEIVIARIALSVSADSTTDIAVINTPRIGAKLGPQQFISPMDATVRLTQAMMTMMMMMTMISQSTSLGDFLHLQELVELFGAAVTNGG